MPRSILVVEDGAALMRKITSSVCRPYEVVAAGSYGEAVETLVARSSEIAGAIIDIRLTPLPRTGWERHDEPDGLDLVIWMREHGHVVPVLVLTGAPGIYQARADRLGIRIYDRMFILRFSRS